MKYDPNIHRRRSIRLSGHDYSKAGAYFVTICTEHRECLFGEIRDGEMHPNEAGHMVEAMPGELMAHYPCVRIPTFMLMPNHVHAIIALCDDDSETLRHTMTGAGTETCPYRRSLSDVIYTFKSLTTTR